MLVKIENRLQKLDNFFPRAGFNIYYSVITMSKNSASTLDSLKIPC